MEREPLGGRGPRLPEAPAVGSETAPQRHAELNPTLGFLADRSLIIFAMQLTYTLKFTIVIDLAAFNHKNRKFVSNNEKTFLIFVVQQLDTFF